MIVIASLGAVLGPYAVVLAALLGVVPGWWGRSRPSRWSANRNELVLGIFVDSAIATTRALRPGGRGASSRDGRPATRLARPSAPCRRAADPFGSIARPGRLAATHLARPHGLQRPLLGLSAFSAFSA